MAAHPSAPEMAGRMGYTGNRLVRGGEGRDEATLEAALADPAARVFLRRENQWLSHSADAMAPGFRVPEAERLGLVAREAVLLGHTAEGAPRLCADLPVRAASDQPSDAAVAPDPLFEWPARDLRAIGLEGAVDPDVEGQLAQAQHFLNWHGRNRFCGRCGSPSVAEAAGYRRRCTACGDLRFPRTDPVTIMLVHDGAGACVLGRQPRFPEGFWSCLAGFVEPGETLEDAVRRETMEEAGLRVGPVTYRASQPWPFPGSLMIGCTAVATSREISFDGEELEACRWFAREEVRAMLAGEHPDGLQLPQPFAIAHHLIRTYVDNIDS